mmetsp:Transcript_159984/g.513316  ORF Transcript_159984/g.513316 Transcript_159984/m.513316 type:complete len:224 (-) Transcript_159984:139-810(-)
MYGLRKIINGRPAATDGKEWIIYGDPGFNQGRVAQPEVLHGSLPMEHVRARKFAKAVSAAGMGARGAVASSDAVRAKMTKQKWSKHMAEPTLMDQTCPGVVAREKSKAKSFEEAVAASTAKNPGGSRGPYWTASSELHSPALKLPTFPVAKFFYHGEVPTLRCNRASCRPCGRAGAPGASRVPQGRRGPCEPPDEGAAEGLVAVVPEQSGDGEVQVLLGADDP